MFAHLEAVPSIYSTCMHPCVCVVTLDHLSEQLIGRLLRSMFPQLHNQLFYNFVSIVSGLLDGSMLFEAPASITDLLSSCKADFTLMIAAMNDAPLITNICNDGVSDDSGHKIVAKLLKETSDGKSMIMVISEVMQLVLVDISLTFLHRKKMSRNFV